MHVQFKNNKWSQFWKDLQAYFFNRCIQPLLRSQQFHGNFKCFKFNYSFLRWIFIIWLFIVFIIVNFLRMFDHFIVVQFISNKKILCIIWPSVFDHPVFYGFHISSVLTNHVVKKTITNIKYYTLVDFFCKTMANEIEILYNVFFFIAFTGNLFWCTCICLVIWKTARVIL